MKIKNILFFLLIVAFEIVTAQNSERKFVKFQKNASYIEVFTNDGLYRIQPYSTKIIETSFVPNGEQYTQTSEAVILKPENVKFKVEENDAFILLKTKGISAKITKSPFQITYFFNSNFLISERKGYLKNEGFEILDFNLTDSEILYGGGARALGMNRRGYKLQLYNRAHYGYETHSELMNYTMPLVYSSKKYAILFDNAPIGFLDLDSQKNNTLQYQTISGRKTYQVIAANTWEELVETYTDLTGKQPMIPRWALGNFSSRFGYHSQKETEKTINKFFEEEIPVDAVILDLYWFGKDIKGTMGNLEFYKDSFPNPQQMIANLKAKGVKTILITEPFILTTSNKWKEAVDKDILGKTIEGKPYTYDFYFGNTGIIDIFKPEGKQWFWNVYEKFAKDGVAGWWGDLGEPEVHPSDLIHAIGTADEVHNIYGHHWAKLIYEGYQKEFPNIRPFILMRAGYAGSQRYGLIPWSGDVNRTWGGLQSQVEIALQMGMQGLAFMHSDLGGFAGANLDDELYTRWLQYGVFQPVFRPHAQEEIPSEPVFRAFKTKQLAKEAIKLRYKLMPYNYTLVYKNNQLGEPLMKPLFFEDETLKTLVNNTTYLWGDNFLICPVVEAQKKEQEMYFPATANWFNFYTDEKVEGGQTKLIPLKEEHIPTYVRGGAFIPMIHPIQTSESYSLKNAEVHFYFDENVKQSTDILYNDDGETTEAFEKGMFELITFSSKQKGNCLKIGVKTQKGQNFRISEKNVTLILHNIQEKPKKIKGYNFEWNSVSKTLKIPVSLQNSSSKNIKIKFHKK